MSTARELLLTRHGLVFVTLAPSLQEASPAAADGAALELAALGYVLAPRLAQRLAALPSGLLAEQLAWLKATLLAQVGGDPEHVPLFRRFPADVPTDTAALWWQKVGVHYLQAPDQPCITCGQRSTTHVLDPCRHVVCDLCFDGTTYSACPVCEHHVDRRSPFFTEAPPPRGLSRLVGRGALPRERVRFKRLDLGEDLEQAARTLLEALCRRRQALSPDDRVALTSLVRELGPGVLASLPQVIAVRETEALLLGTLLTSGAPPDTVLAAAASRLRTATDVLRLIAVLSGEDGSLQPVTRLHRARPAADRDRRFPGHAPGVQASSAARYRHARGISMQVRRFKIAPLPRPLRRALLTLLESLDEPALIEDMLAHRSAWVAVGERLHPHEHARRFPRVARAFAVVRGKAPDGTPAPVFQSFRARVEAHLAAGEGREAAALLAERPGELARRLDHLLRSADASPVLARFAAQVAHVSTPVLLALKAHLPQRLQPALVRVHWPKGKQGRGVSTPDRRPVLAAAVVASALQVVDHELLRRFALQPHYERALIDAALGSVLVPFNERTASAAAISLPRGSRLAVPPARVLRLLLHWCQPEQGGRPTDLDLSVGFFGEGWIYRGVCSYYELTCLGRDGQLLARSAGDLRDAPWPEGATELVDVHLEAVRAAGIRYAVMVVNAYNGLAFGELERVFAGIMLRDDVEGAHVDPRTVALRFNLAGEHGVYLPLVIDVREGVLHWLDVHARGTLTMNNVATSTSDIQRICPELMAYFASGSRLSMADLALLHAAARCQEITVRGPHPPGGQGPQPCVVRRQPGETPLQLYRRLQAAVGGSPVAPPGDKATAGAPLRSERDGVPAEACRLPAALCGEATSPGEGVLQRRDAPMLAVLLRGDVEVPAGSAAYALFREQVLPTLAASDLIT